ncbi:hypothetical protein [Streptomyces sp. BA2]|uniref:hypothetical protein n=1 Tax=Streptomyces sp. BA2 TaxID=436595 RepID=UPI001320EAC1|nr:hypothetical protein [Streptomyces sp. BA2]MWA14904.1 hypothetical protein [Streptomyces sp. BA2]
MTGAGVHRRVLPAALVAVLLVIVQLFAHGVNASVSAVESRTPPATAPYAQCGDDTHPEESERFRARGRPHCRDLTPDPAPQLHARTDTTPADGTRAYLPVAVAHRETRPAGRELPPLLQVFRC